MADSTDPFASLGAAPTAKDQGDPFADLGKPGAAPAAKAAPVKAAAEPKPAKPSFGDRLVEAARNNTGVGLLDAGATLASGMASGLVGQAGQVGTGVANLLRGGKPGDEAGIAEEFQRKWTHEPVTPLGKNVIEGVGKVGKFFADDLKIPPIINPASTVSAAATHLAGPAMREAAPIVKAAAQGVAASSPVQGGVALGKALGTGAADLGAALTRKVSSSSPPLKTAMAHKAERDGFTLEAGQLSKDKPIGSPGFTEGTRIENEKLVTKKALDAAGLTGENITPGFVGAAKKQLGEIYDSPQLFGKQHTVDEELAQLAHDAAVFERRVSPGGNGSVFGVARNIFGRWQAAVDEANQVAKNKYVQQLMKKQQPRGGVMQFQRAAKDWGNRRKADAADAPAWAKPATDMVNDLAKQMGLPNPPEVWFGNSVPRAGGGTLYGQAWTDGHIIVNDALDMKGGLATVLHEFGHHTEFNLLVRQPPEVIAAMKQAWKDTKKTHPEGTLTVSQHRPITADKYSKSSQSSIVPKGSGSGSEGYFRNFQEWWAEQTSRWITTTQQPTNLVEKFFAGVAAHWKAIYQKITGHIPLAKEVDAFYKKNWKGDLIQEAADRAGIFSADPGAGPVHGLGSGSGVTTKINGKEIQTLRSHLTGIARDRSKEGTDRHRASELVAAIDENIKRHDPVAAQLLDSTNRRYAAVMTLQDGIEHGFVKGGKLSPEGLGTWLSHHAVGYGSGTSKHPMYDLGITGKELGIRSRAEGSNFPAYDMNARLFGRARQAVGNLLGRGQWRRGLQRMVSEREFKQMPVDEQARLLQETGVIGAAEAQNMVKSNKSFDFPSAAPNPYP